MDEYKNSLLLLQNTENNNNIENNKIKNYFSQTEKSKNLNPG